MPTVLNLAGGHISVEPITSPSLIFRYHPNGYGYGAPYSCAFTVQITGDEARILAMAGEFKPVTRRCIREALKALGVKRAKWERTNAGGHRQQHGRV